MRLRMIILSRVYFGAPGYFQWSQPLPGHVRLLYSIELIRKSLLHCIHLDFLLLTRTLCGDVMSYGVLYLILILCTDLQLINKLERTIQRFYKQHNILKGLASAWEKWTTLFLSFFSFKAYHTRHLQFFLINQPLIPCRLSMEGVCMWTKSKWECTIWLG